MSTALILACIIAAAIGTTWVFRERVDDFVNAVLAKADQIVAPRGGTAGAGVMLTIPAIAVLFAFTVAPFFYGLYLSVHDTRWGQGPYVGAEKYTDALQNSGFWQSLSVTMYYAIGVVPLCIALSAVVANLLFRMRTGRGLFRTIFFLPFVTSTVASATVWRVIFHNRHGAINLTLASLGFDPANLPQWLIEPRGVLSLITGGAVGPSVGPSLALCCIIIFEIWRSSGFMIVVILAGLSAVPRELEDAARIDGAGSRRVFWHVTLPMISPTLFFLAIVSSISALQNFDAFYALTGDGLGPLNTTRSMTVYIYTEFFVHGREGYGAAVATILCTLIIVLSLVQWRVVGRRVHYG